MGSASPFTSRAEYAHHCVVVVLCYDNIIAC